jgi:hypothetical protein
MRERAGWVTAEGESLGKDNREKRPGANAGAFFIGDQQ